MEAALHNVGLDWCVEDSVQDVGVVDQGDTAVVLFERVVFQLARVAVQLIKVVVQSV